MPWYNLFPKHQTSPGPNSRAWCPQAIKYPGDVHEGLSGIHYELAKTAQELDLEVTAGRTPPKSFATILLSLLPEDIQLANKDSLQPKDIMERLKVAGKTTWVVFKRVLDVVKEASDPFPPLKTALTALSLVLEQLDMMNEAQDEFFSVSSKLVALQQILYRYRGSRRVKERLIGLQEWAESVKVYIHMQTERNAAKRFILASDDVGTVKQLLQSFETVIDFFMLDTNLSAEDYASRLSMKMDDLVNHVQLRELGHVAEAGWGAQSDDQCLTGTRCKVMADLIQWCNDPEQPRVFWLSGMAGTGKSAIARTLCDRLRRAHLLGGSFFCSRRGVAEQREVKRIIPTLARHLARLDPEYTQDVVERLKLDSDLKVATIERQLEELLANPRSKAFRKLKTPLILVIDALDEGAQVEDTARLLEAILSKADTMPFRFFLTSRPESHIRDKFSRSLATKRIIFHLHDIEESMVKADIQLYVRHRLVEIKAECRHPLPEEWPTNEQVQQLADRADKLFIYAFTACKYIQRDPEHRLNIVAQTAIHNERPLMQRLDDMYTLILDEAKNDNAGSEIVSDIQKCLTALVCVQEALSVAGLATLMETEPSRIRIVMDDLHSLILVPESDSEGVVTTLHASLGDYLNDEKRSAGHAITKDAANWILLRRCLQVMSQELHFNISKASTSFHSNDQQGLELSYTIVYSAANWARHMAEIAPSKELVSTIVAWVKDTLIPKFLFWLEVMSVSKKVDEAIEMLLSLLRFFEEQGIEPDIVDFLRDALSFVNGAYEAIQRSAPHIYLSALSLCYQESRIKRKFEADYGRIPVAHWEGAQRSKPWLLCIGKLVDGDNGVSSHSQHQAMHARNTQPSGGEANSSDVHTEWITSVALSPDGKCIASGSRDSTIRLWAAQTGRPMIDPLQGHDGPISSVGFSPDGKYIVSGSRDSTVRIWDAQTGQPMLGPLQGHNGLVCVVAFSPDGQRIISGSSDTTVRVWDAQSGRPIMDPLRGHTGLVSSAVFSPDGKYIVSGSSDKTVRMWSAETGQLIMDPLQARNGLVCCVAISPDGKYIVSGSSDKSVYIWDAETGQPVMDPLQGHTDYVLSVAFSPDNRYIVSGSSDKTVRVWDVQTGQPMIWPLQGHTLAVTSVAFLPSGKYIISGSYDKTVRMWDAQTVSGLYGSQATLTSDDRDIARRTTAPSVADESTLSSPAATGTVCFSPNTNHGFLLPVEFSTSPSGNTAGGSRDIFSFNPKSGWILGPHKELFLWIPADVRSSLWLPWNARFTSDDHLYLDLSGYSCGSHWTDCRRSLVPKTVHSVSQI